MAHYPNMNYVDDILDHIRDDIFDYVELVLRAKYNDQWIESGVKPFLNDCENEELDKLHTLEQRGRYLDPEKLLKVIKKSGRFNFSNPVDHSGKPLGALDINFAYRVYSIRCEVSHKNPLKCDYSVKATKYALEDIARFVEPINDKTHTYVCNKLKEFLSSPQNRPLSDIDPFPGNSITNEQYAQNPVAGRNFFLVSMDSEQCHAWEREFSDYPNVTIVCSELTEFLADHPEIDALATSSDSFSTMSGGFDLAILEYYGKNLRRVIKNKINEQYCGLQPVGTAITVDFKRADGKDMTLVSVPSMLYPARLVDTRIVFQCMRSALLSSSTSLNMVVTGFGGCCGGADAYEIAKMMRLAFDYLGEYEVMNDNAYIQLVHEMERFCIERDLM